VKPDYDLSQPPDTGCPHCHHRWPGEREFCPNCGRRVRGRRPFSWSCGVIVLVGLALFFGCVGACGLVVVLSPDFDKESLALKPMFGVIGLVAAAIAAALLFGAIKLGRRP